MRAALALVVLSCTPQAASAPDAESEEPPEAVEPEARTRPGDLCALPIILRCPKPNTGCTLAVRARRRDGVLELLAPSSFFRDEAPIVVDEERVYWPGSAAFKRDLTALELDWRSASVRSIDEHGDELIVVDEEGVYLLPKDGSPMRPIASRADVWSAAAGPSFLAWTIDGGGQGMVVVASHGGAVTQQIPQESPHGARISGSLLVWFDFGSTGPENPTGAIRRLADDAAVTIADGQYIPRDLTVDGEHVYWVTDEREGRVAHRALLAGGEVERLGVSYELEGHRGNRDRIVVQGDHVYWNAAHTIVRVPRSGGTAEMVVTVDVPGDIVSFAVDDTHIYATAQIYPTTPR